jgi:hypothetical protein
VLDLTRSKSDLSTQSEKADKPNFGISEVEQDLSKTRADLRQLVEKMIVYNPLLRQPAETLLKESIFDDIRVKRNEHIGSRITMNLDFDKNRTVPMDPSMYEPPTAAEAKKQVTKFRELITEEIVAFNINMNRKRI